MPDNEPEIPDAPSFFQDPRFGSGIDQLFGIGNLLTQSENTGALPGLLRSTVDLNPDVTSLALQGVRSRLAPVLRESRKGIINELAANNQLESSVTADRLADLQTDYESSLLATTSQAALSDATRALTNRFNLYGTGLNTLSTATSLAGQNQQQRNAFELANYENRVAKAQSEADDSGGIFGGLLGAAGGALGGLALAPFTGGASLIPVALGATAGGLSGATGSRGVGTSFLTQGASLLAQQKALDRQIQELNTIFTPFSGV